MTTLSMFHLVSATTGEVLCLVVCVCNFVCLFVCLFVIARPRENGYSREAFRVASQWYSDHAV